MSVAMFAMMSCPPGLPKEKKQPLRQSGGPKDIDCGMCQDSVSLVKVKLVRLRE
jgi:hypothetical protein